VPLTEFVRGVAAEAGRSAGREVMEEYRRNCPIRPRVERLEAGGKAAAETRRTWGGRAWGLMQTAFAVALGWVLAKIK